MSRNQPPGASPGSPGSADEGSLLAKEAARSYLDTNTFSGWMNKKGPRKNDAYRRRWFVLDGLKLSYWKTENTSKRPAGHIMIDADVTSERGADGDPSNLKIMGPRLKRVFVIRADSSAECLKWISVLRVAVEKAGGAPSSPTISISSLATFPSSSGSSGGSSPSSSASSSASSDAEISRIAQHATDLYARTREFSGWLSKQGGVRSAAYRRRWFALRDVKLSYWKSRDDKEKKRAPAGSIIIDPGVVVRPDPDSDDESSTSCNFLIVGAQLKRPFRLRSDEVELCVQWVAVLRAAVKFARGEMDDADADRGGGEETDLVVAEDAVEDRFALLPHVKEFQILSLLGGSGGGGGGDDETETGSSAVGMMLKVKNVRTDKIATMLVMDQEVSAGRRTDFLVGNFLIGASHPNVARVVAGFLFPRNPLLLPAGDDDDDASSDTPCFCLVVEFFKGTPLEELLQNSEKSEFVLSAPTTLRWFFELLSAVEFFSEKGFLLRDINPRSIRMHHKGGPVRRPLLPKRHSARSRAAIVSMEVKLTDFARSTPSDAEVEDLVRDLGNECLFCAPELLLGESPLDSKCDIWSVGLLLHLIFFGMSQKKYSEAVRQLFVRIMATDETHREEFCKMFRKDNFQEGETQVHQLVAYLASKNVIWDEVLFPAAKREPAVVRVLRKMICLKEDRLTAEQISQLPEIMTWKFLLGLCSDETEVANARLNLDLDALLAMLRGAAPRDIVVVRKVIETLLEISETLKLTDREAEIMNAVLRGWSLMDDDSELDWLTIRLFNVLISQSSDSKKTLRRLSVAVRGYNFVAGTVKLLESVASMDEGTLSQLNPRDVNALLRFVTSLLKQSSTIAKTFGPLSTAILSQVLGGGPLSSSFAKMLLWVLPTVDDKSQIDALLEPSNSSRMVEFFEPQRGLSAAWKNPKFAPRLYRAIRLSLNRLRPSDDAQSVKNVLYLLLHLGFTVLPPKSGMNLKEGAKNATATLRIKKGPASHVALIGEQFEVLSLRGRTKIVSTEVLFGSGEEEEEEGESDSNTVVAYYEVSILDGGRNDFLRLGFEIGEDEYLIAPTKMQFVTPGGEEQQLSSLSSEDETFPFSTGTTFGVGLLSDRTMFLTFGGKLITREMSVESLRQVSALIAVSSNADMKAEVNFGAKPFIFRFENVSAESSDDSFLRTIAGASSLKDLPEALDAFVVDEAEDDTKAVIRVLKDHLVANVEFIEEDEFQ